MKKLFLSLFLLVMAVSTLSAGHPTGNAYEICPAYSPAFNDGVFFSSVYYQGTYYDVIQEYSINYTSPQSWNAILKVESEEDGSTYIAAAESNGYSDENASSPWSIKFCTVYSNDD